MHGNLQPTIKIKLEIDTAPPAEFSTEYKLSLLPYSFMARVYTLPSAFAGKMHALLFRSWKARVKGRDWYDFEWYVRNDVALSLPHFNARALQTGHLDAPVDASAFLALLNARISAVSLAHAKDDIRPFIRDTRSLDMWSPEYFRQLGKMIRFDCT